MIMTTSEHFDTIADSLADAAENHWNALDALPADSDSREAARDLANDYERVQDRWLAGLPLDDEDDVTLAVEALTTSENNCRELADGEPSFDARAAMLNEADGYEAARLHLEG